jgi:hypothetical protein
VFFLEEHDYVYRIGTLLYQGLTFLILYPLITYILYLITGYSRLEVLILIIIYLLSLFGLLGVWIYAKSKRIRIEDQQITFKSILGEYILEPADVRRVVFHWDAKGREIVQVWTKGKSFSLSEYYFPFPELMSDLENFIKSHDIRTNLAGQMTTV